MEKKEKEKIVREAKQIIDSFSEALARVETEAEKEEFFVVREQQLRKEGNGKKAKKKFRKIFFENAPHEGDYIKAERGEWK